MSEKVTRPLAPLLIVAIVLTAAIFGAWVPSDPVPVTDVLSSMYGEFQGAAMGHALIGLLIFSGLLAVALKKRVIPTPHLKILLPLAIVEFAVAVSFGVSQYRHLSLMTMIEWLAYGAAFVLTVASVGRGSGVRLVLIAFTLAGAWLALLGIREYGDQPDATWRIFAHTMGPNVLAAFLVVTLFPACALVATEDRVGKLLGGIGGSAIVASLMLTGSKGGLLAAIIGAIAMVLTAGKHAKQIVVGLAICATVGFTLSYAITHRPTKQSVGGSPLARVSGAGATSEQSSGFRKNLWVGSAKLIAANPVGYGIGTYRFQSARPGTTTQTQLAHNSFLQLGVETGVLGLTGFLVFLALLARTTFSRTGQQPPLVRMQKSAVVGSIGAFLAHSIFDSDLQIFGLGIMFFVLSGVALQLAVDGSTPEFLRPALRRGLIAASCLLPFAMLYFGWVDLKHGLLLGGLSGSNPQQLKSDMKDLQRLAPLDSRVFFTSYQISASAKVDHDQWRPLLLRAISLGPTLAMYRALARLSKTDGAASPDYYLDKVYEFDPYNYPGLQLDIELNRIDNPDRAKRAAEKLVASEATPYFTIRSIPEVIPLETFKARIYLAEALSGSAKAAMLKPAVEGFGMYAKTTIPEIRRFAISGFDGGYGGTTKAEALSEIETGLALVESYRLVGDASIAESVRSALEVSRESLR